MATTAAAFGTAELFEEILSYLTMEELTRAQQVSRAWQDSIMASPALKRTLLFEMQLGDIVPLIQREKAKYRKRISTVVFEQPADRGKSKYYPILRFAPPIQVRTEKRWHTDESGHRYKSNLYHLSIDVRDLLARMPGAWEQMRLTQPPLMDIEVEFSAVAAIGLPGEDFWDYMHLLKANLTNPDGIRIKDLTGMVRELMRGYESDLGEEVHLTSFCEATFTAPKHVFEGSKEVRKAFRRQQDGFVDDPFADLDLADLGLVLDEVGDSSPVDDPPPPSPPHD